MRILGLDLGEKRIGLSISDENKKIALPFKSISKIEDLKEICQKNEIAKIVIGLPKTLRGEEGREAKKVRKLGKEIEKETGLPIIFEDERLSSREALRILKEEGIKIKKTKEKIDVLAAVLILQSYLDRKA